jgi:biotin--protein ligase
MHTPARLREGRTLPLLQYVVTLAVVEAIQDMAHDALAGFPEPKEAPAEQEAPPPGTRPRLLDVRIKWPNDIYAGGLKARYCVLQADDQSRMSIIVWRD